MALVLLLLGFPACTAPSPVDDDDDSAAVSDDDDTLDDDDSVGSDDDDTPPPEAACRVEGWLIADSTGQELDDAPNVEFYSDAVGRWRYIRTRLGGDGDWQLRELLRYDPNDAATLAVGLGDYGWPPNADFFWSDGKMISWVSPNGEDVRQLDYVSDLLVADRGAYGDCCDGRSRDFVYGPQGRLSELFERYSPDWTAAPPWSKRTTFEYDAGGCLLSLDMEFHEPADGGILYVFEHTGGRVTTLRESPGWDVYTEYRWFGACDNVEAGLPKWPGVPLWFDDFLWPVGTCVDP